MQNSKKGDFNITIKEHSSPQWRVIHLPYPRETQEYSCIGIRWTHYGKIKLPMVFIYKKTLEKREPTVNYDLLCQQIEDLLNSDEAQGYDLFSINTTFSGVSAMTSFPTRPQHQFLKRRIPEKLLQGKEALIIILKRQELQ